MPVHLSVKKGTVTQYHTIPEFAEAMHLTRTATYILIKKGKLKTVRLGKYHFITDGEFRRWTPVEGRYNYKVRKKARKEVSEPKSDPMM